MKTGIVTLADPVEDEDRHDQSVDRDTFGEPHEDEHPAQQLRRITSYNVCYTKLLRTAGAIPMPSQKQWYTVLYACRMKLNVIGEVTPE